MPTKNIEDACPLLQDAWPTLRQKFAALNTGRYLQLECVYRSPDEQLADFEKGRAPSGTTGSGWTVLDHTKVITNVDGTKVIGQHNKHPSRAIDVSVWDNQTGKPIWTEEAFASLGPICVELGLVWGGNWSSIKDFDHIECPAGE